MEENAGEELLTHKKSSVVVKEVNADDSSVEAISISHALVEILIKDPVCGRSDYSDLPGVRRGVCSSWRSFAEYPRRTGAYTRHQADTPVNTTEERRQKNYEAKIRRENLTLQRVAKRERLRAQQRERRRQQTLLNKLQGQSADVGNSCLNPGVIISSPKKGSPKKLSRNGKNEDSHSQKNVDCGENSKTLHCHRVSWKQHSNSKDKVRVSWKPHGNSKDRVNYGANSFDDGDDDDHDDDRTGMYFDEVVSTTSTHHDDVDTLKSSKTSLTSTISSASQDKNIIFNSFRESEDNPVTSSSQDTTENLSLKPIPSDKGRSSMSTACVVTSTTAPEIADADSSTMSAQRRKTRNVKRVDYTEMLEDDFDQDLEQQSFRESVNSGRKIRPVKRTLEKAIVDASLKKSPRKKKTVVVDKKGGKSGPQPHSVSSSNTDAEGDKGKQIKNVTKKSSTTAAHKAEKSSSVANVSSGHNQTQCIPTALSADVSGHCLPASTTAIFQPHSLCLSNNTSYVSLPVHSAFVSGSLSNRQLSYSNQFVSTLPPSAPHTFQPIMFPCQQQPYSAPVGNTVTIHPSSVIPSHGLQNSSTPTCNTFNSVMQSPFNKSLPVMNPQGIIQYPVSSLTLPQTGMQIHTSQPLLSVAPSYLKDTVVYDMNHSLQPPDLFLESQQFISAPNCKVACSVNTSQPVIRHETATSQGQLLNESIARASLAYQHTAGTSLDSPVCARQQQLLCTQNMMTDYSVAQFLTSLKHINSNGSSNVANNSACRDNTEILSCKKQSQFDVESMLNSIPRSKINGKSIDNSDRKLSCNKTLSSKIRNDKNQNKSESELAAQSAQKMAVAPRLTSQEVPGLSPKLAEVSQSQPQYVTFSLVSQSSGPQEYSLSGQTALLQPSYHQSLEKSHATVIGPPPPLISVSDLLNSSVSVSSCGIKQGNSASLAYQNMSSLTSSHIKYVASSAGALPSASQSALKKSCMTGDITSQVESLMQRSVMTARPSSISQHKVGSLHQQSMQPQLSHPGLQYSDAFLLSSKVNSVPQPIQYSRSPHDQLLRMPALMSFLNNSHPTERTQEGCQINRTPVNCFTDKPISHSIVTPRNLTPEQRVATGMIRGQKPQVSLLQERRNQPGESVRNVHEMHRLPTPRPAYKPGGAIAQKYTQNNRNTSVAAPRVPLSNPEAGALRETRAPDPWKLPLRQESAQSTTSNSAVGKLCNDQVLQEASMADCSPYHTNLHSVPSRIFQQSPAYRQKNADSAKVLNDNSGMPYLYSIAKDQRALEQVSSITAARILQSPSMNLPNRPTRATIRKTNLKPSAQYTMQTDKPAVSITQANPEAGLVPIANILLHALDLSQKSSYGSQKSVTMAVTSSVTSSVNPSFTIISSLSGKKPVTVLVTSSVNSSVTAAISRLPGQTPVTVPVTPNVNPSVTTTVSRLPGQKIVTITVTKSVNPSVTTVSSLSQGNATTTANKTPKMTCDYPLTRPQIKQESMSQSDQTEDDTSHILQPGLRKCQMPAEERVTSCHMAEGRPSGSTSTLPSALSSQNYIPARGFVQLQTNGVANSRDNTCTTVNSSLMSVPASVNNPRILSVGDLIKIKVETHVSHGDNSGLASASPAATVATSLPLSQAAIFARAPQVPVSGLVTSRTTEAQLSSRLLEKPRPSLAQPQVLETTSALHAVRGRDSHAYSEPCLPPHQSAVMKDSLPAHIRIKQEIHADTMQNLTSESSLSKSSTLHSAIQTSVASVTKNSDTSDLAISKSSITSSDSVSTFAAVSTEASLPRRSVQYLDGAVEAVLAGAAGSITKSPPASTESTLSSHTVEYSPDFQPVPKVASRTHYISDLINSASGESVHSQSLSRDQPRAKYTAIKVEQSSVVDSSSHAKTENLLASSSTPECLVSVSQTMVPVCSLAVTTEPAVAIARQVPSYALPRTVNNSCDKYPHEEPARTQTTGVISPLPPAVSPNKQSIIKVSPSKLDSVSTDPLFAWHTDSNKQLSSFSMGNITNSLSQDCEQNVPGLFSEFPLINNFYTVTVSYPCTENSHVLHCDTVAPSVDMSVVKVEPSMEPALNQREVIDLCLSDSEENDLLDTEATSCVQEICPDSVNSTSQLICSSRSQDELQKAEGAQRVAVSKDMHLSVDNPLRTPTKEYSHQRDVMSPLETSATVYHGISKSAAKQIIKSPLTGQNVSVSGEHVTFIRRRLARISTDLMSITSDITESETPSISTRNLSRQPSAKLTDEAVSDSVTEVFEQEQALLNTNAAGTEVHPAITQFADTSVNTSKTHTRKKIFNTLEVNTKRASSTRKQTRGVEVKKEYIEAISIDDDSNEEGFEQPEIPHFSKSSEVCLSGASSASSVDAPPSIFSMPFGPGAPVLSPQKDLSSLSGSELSVMSPSHNGAGGNLLASIANWTNDEVSEWLRNHKLDKVCPNLKNLDGRGLQRMAFEHQRDPDMFYTRVKKTLGLTFFQTMVICHSMKELNDGVLDEC